MASLEEIQETRRGKLKLLREKGIDPYPVSVDRNMSVSEARDRFEELEKTKKPVVLAGRILSIRAQGKIIFFNFQDGTGKFQAFLKSEEPLPLEEFELFGNAFDIGDFAEIRGTLILTKNGEKTILAESVRMLAKSLRPLPEKWHGLEDVDTRFRERELDILSDESVRERFVTRAKMVSAIRKHLDSHGFLEFETPVLQAIPGGANARPFVTHHHALDLDLYLRIATEIHLKRLIVGGFDKVYEIGRLFRNEGIDHSHNPEFTTLEMYWAYAGKDEYIAFLEDLLRFAEKEATGENKIFVGEWPRITFREAVLDSTGIDIDKFDTTESLVKAVEEKGIQVDFSNSIGLGEHYDQLFKKTARAKIEEPTWILDYPLELKPLANKSSQDETKSSSAQLIIGGDEIVNAYYHELNDPEEQRSRFETQEKLREKGSEAAQRIDEEFLRSLEYGMPPTAGVGIGMDRLAMLLTGTENIKEVILFPTMRPKSD